MTIWQAAILGIVQGLTEFLPISSSGHLVILQQLFGIQGSNLTFDVVIHQATLLAIIIFFGKSLLKVTRKEWFFVAVGTIPAVLIGLLFKDFFDALFANDKFVGLELIVTGLINFYTDYRLRNPKQLNAQLTWQKSLLIGLGQAVAIIPGISRSGTTVSTAIALKIDRESAFRFSFLLAIPALLGAGVLEFKDLLETGASDVSIMPLLVGSMFAFIFGVLSLRFFKYVISKAKLEWFGWYCVIVGLFVLFITFK